MIPEDWSIPSSSASMMLSSLGVTSSPAYMSRCFAMASISSKKMMLGFLSLASLNNSATFVSDSPYHLDMISEHFTVTISTCNSLANAFMSMVFPQPGGPNSKIPLGGSIPYFWATSLMSSGIMMDSFRSSLTSSRPPTSSKLLCPRFSISDIRVPTLASISRFVKYGMKNSLAARPRSTVTNTAPKSIAPAVYPAELGLSI